MMRKLRPWSALVLLALTATVVAVDSQLGPSGGTGGSPFVDVIPEGARIVEVKLWGGKRVDAFQIFYETAGGVRGWLPKRGGSGGKEVTPPLQLGRDEYINEIRGRYGDRVDSLVIDLETKRDWFGYKAGGDGGKGEYKYTAPPGTQIVGFTGRAGKEIDAIGVVLRPRP